MAVRMQLDNYTDEASGNYKYSDGNKRIFLYGRDDKWPGKTSEGKVTITNPLGWNIEVRTQDVDKKIGKDSYGSWRSSWVKPGGFLTFRGPKESGKNRDEDFLIVEVHVPDRPAEQETAAKQITSSRTKSAEVLKDLGEVANKVSRKMFSIIGILILLVIFFIIYIFLKARGVISSVSSAGGKYVAKVRNLTSSNH
jgi:hypothetical protein